MFLARLVSLIGDFLTPVALAYAVLDTLRGNATDVGIVLAATIASSVLFMLIGGAWGDRAQPIRIMIGADLGRFAVQATACVTLATGHATVWLLAAFSFLRGVGAAFFTPASTAVLPRLVPEDDLQAANALRGLAGSGAVVLGPAIAGALVPTIGPGWTLGADALTFLISALLLRNVHVESRLPVSIGKGIWRQIRDGWAQVAMLRWVWLVIATASAIHLLSEGPLQTLAPVISKLSYGGAGAYAQFLVAAGAGSLLGGALALHVDAPRPLVVAVASLPLTALPALTLALRAPLGFVLLAYALTGLAAAVFSVFWATALQRWAPRDALGRIASYDALGSVATLPLGALLAGPVSSALGIHRLLWIAVAASLLLTVPLPFLPSIRRAHGRPDSGDPVTAELLTQS